MNTKKVFTIALLIFILAGCHNSKISTNSEVESSNPISLIGISTISSGSLSAGSSNPDIPIENKLKDTLNLTLDYRPITFNSILTSNISDDKHIPNFIDGLVEYDQFGRVVHALADTIKVNSIHDEFTFTIRDNVKWMTHNGQQYSPSIDGTNTPQVITAEDFVNAAKLILDYNNGASGYSQFAMFIKGGYEYWAYTYAIYLRDNNLGDTIGLSAAVLATDPGIAAATNNIAKWIGNVDLNVKSSDLGAISRFDRVGIKASVNNGKSVLTYKLENPSPYFLTTLNFTPFLPINLHFINELGGINNYGLSPESMLFCGAFLLKSFNQDGMIYVQNPEYWDQESYRFKQVNYKTVIDNSVDYRRLQFENGSIDEFEVNISDESGWEKYVLGPNATGTKINPYHVNAYQDYNDRIDTRYNMQINVNRPRNLYLSNLTVNDLDNDNKALKINSVRELFLKGIDLHTYNTRYGEEYRNQYQINTVVPSGFVSNRDNGKDYVEYFYEEYAKRYDAERYNGTTSEKETALEDTKAKFAPNQVDGINLTKEEIKALAQQAKADIDLVNSDENTDSLLQSIKGITFPIKIEHLGPSFNPDVAYYDDLWIEEFNQDVNSCTLNVNNTSASLPYCAESKYPYFEIVNNRRVTESTYALMLEGGNYHLMQMGWSPDYGDPLTYLEAYTTGNTMALLCGINSQMTDAFVENGTVKSRNILEEFDRLISTGKEFYVDDDERLTFFAKGEVELINNTNIIRPFFRSELGYSVKVSRLIRFNQSLNNYGISGLKLKNVYAYTFPMSAKDRNDAKLEYEQAKQSAYNKGYIIYNGK